MKNQCTGCFEVRGTAGYKSCLLQWHLCPSDEVRGFHKVRTAEWKSRGKGLHCWGFNTRRPWKTHSIHHNRRWYSAATHSLPVFSLSVTKKHIKARIPHKEHEKEIPGLYTLTCKKSYCTYRSTKRAKWLFSAKTERQDMQVFIY